MSTLAFRIAVRYLCCCILDKTLDAGINPHPHINRQERKWGKKEWKQPFTMQWLPNFHSGSSSTVPTVLVLCRILTGDHQESSIHNHRAAKNDWRGHLFIPGNRAPQIPGKSWGSHYHGLARAQLHFVSSKTGPRRIQGEVNLWFFFFYLISLLRLHSLIFNMIGGGLETSRYFL